MKSTVIEWEKVKDSFHILHPMNWCLVILKPVNFKECDDAGLDYSDWVCSYGFEKAWFNGGKFWVANPHGYGTEEVTDRVVLVAPLPRENLRELL